MSLVAALIYWVIVSLWLIVLATMGVAFVRNPRTFGAARFLLAVLAIDVTRNVIENLYFGLYFGAQYGLFPGEIAGVLGQPHLLIIPKLINVAAAVSVIGLLLHRWLPMASKERLDAEKNLQHSELRFGLLVEAVKEYAIYMLDLGGHVTSWNSGAERINGYSEAEIIGSHISRFHTEDDRAAGVPERTLSIAAIDGRFETEVLRVRKDGTTFWAHVVINAMFDETGKLVGFANVTKDITDRKLAEDKLRHLAHVDQLTGLPNRTSLLRDLEVLLRATDGAQLQPTSIALFDLEGFKDINDTLGHTIGDKLLIEIARRLSEAAGSSGCFYRLGGDDFVLVVAECGDPLVITGIVDSFMRCFDSQFEIDGRSLFVGASAGVVIATEEGLDADAVIAQAALALSDAKKTGGRRASLFMPVMLAEAKARRKIDTELRRACSDKEFELYFQPQIRLRDEAVVGAEALLRWRHPQRGLLSPAAFIEALAQSPVAAQVGNWILQTACENVAAWRSKGFSHLRVGVNLFPAQFHGGQLVSDVEEALRHAGLPPDALELEITENITLGHSNATMTSLRKLRDMGVGIAFDDFGTGYASLSSLAHYPLSRIKIDRSFVDKIEENPSMEETAIVRAMIVMGHNLGLEVVAEGVETREQAAFLNARECDEVQGYLFAKPLPAAEFEQFLEEQRRQWLGDETMPGKLAG